MAPASRDKAAGSTLAALRRIAPLRFVLFVVLSVVATGIAAAFAGWQHAILIGFDTGAAAFLLSLVPLFRNCEADDMRRQAIENDANRILLLAITAVVTLVILVAVALELAAKGKPSAAMIGLVVATLVLSWLFTNTVYALHYAHIFYLRSDEKNGDCGGIDIPETPEPDYWDFVYFAYTLGMTFQTSDCEIQTRHLRRVATFHSLIAFVFNIGVVAFTINVLGSAGG